MNHPDNTMVCPRQKNGSPLEDINITNLSTYTAMWWAWWSLMQPYACITPGTFTLVESTYSMDWMPLCQPGDNSLILVLMMLQWWGVQSQALQGWREALADVTLAIICMKDKSLDNSVFGKKHIHLNMFKTLLLPYRKYTYSTTSTRQKRTAGTSRTQATAAMPGLSTSSTSSHRQPCGQHAGFAFPGPNPPVKT